MSCFVTPVLHCIHHQTDSPGFHASDEAEYANAFSTALSLSEAESLSMRKRARLSAKRFTEAAFASRWIIHVDRLLDLQFTDVSSAGLLDIDTLAVLSYSAAIIYSIWLVL